MDALNDPHVEVISWMASSQVGKSEFLLNVLGYFIDHEPAPMLFVQPTIAMGKAFSKERITPMLRDTPCLKGKVKEARVRASGNNIENKQFPGGYLAITGANSPAALASRPIRVVLSDEVDRWPESAGADGDPLDLAEKRTVTFWNRKLLRTSTPTVEGISRITKAFNEGSREYYFVPCPSCDFAQRLVWKNVVWRDHDPSTAGYACEGCGEILDLDKHKQRMLTRGEWRAEEPSMKSHRSFHISQLYSPWVTLSETVTKFLAATGDPERLQVFTNTALGEVWTVKESLKDPDVLYARREAYDSIPDGVLAITVGIDVQANRFEFEIVGWGVDEESWSLGYRRVMCDPTKLSAWKLLRDAIPRALQTKSGRIVDVALVGIDSGYLADNVYKFSRDMGPHFVVPLKGSSEGRHPIHAFPRKPNQKRVYLTLIGTATAKDVIFQRFDLLDQGPGFCHWPNTPEYDQEYFRQLTGEHRTKHFIKGQPIFVWEQHHPRVEALDCRVYAFVALRIAQEHFGLVLVAPLKAEPLPSLTNAQPVPHGQQPAGRPLGWINQSANNRSGGWFKR